MVNANKIIIVLKNAGADKAIERLYKLVKKEARLTGVGLMLSGLVGLSLQKQISINEKDIRKLEREVRDLQKEKD